MRNDAELIHEFLSSRRESTFLILYRRHTPAVYLFLLRLVAGRRHDAEDILQETWIRAIRKLSEFRMDAKLRSWLFGIAFHCYQENKRQQPAIRDVVEPSMDASQPSSFDLERTIRKLPDGCREILMLHDLYGYTHEEIAGLLNIHPGTSKSQLFEARSKLRAQLQKEKS